MPKKLNFLGGQQNYDADNGQYLPDLTNAQGEPVKSFKSFKKSDEEPSKSSFDTYNDKRTGKKSGEEEINKKGLGYDPQDSKASRENHDKKINELNDKYGKGEISKEEWQDSIDLENDRYQNESRWYYEKEDTPYDKDVAKQQAERREREKAEDDAKVGKIIKYSPFLRQPDGSWKKDDTQQKRIKQLNNGLGIETKAQDKEHYYHEQVGKYRLVDIESGTTVGWAKDFDDALKKSNDQDFIGAIERARKVFYEKHPELKESSGKPVDYNAKRLGKSEGEMAKKEMEKARKRMEKFWADTNANKHMKSEMDYLLSNFEHDNDKKGALELAKDNIKRWQKIGFLDTNEMRDEKLVYFNKMIKYMEKNL